MFRGKLCVFIELFFHQKANKSHIFVLQRNCYTEVKTREGIFKNKDRSSMKASITSMKCQGTSPFYSMKTFKRTNKQTNKRNICRNRQLLSKTWDSWLISCIIRVDKKFLLFSQSAVLQIYIIALSVDRISVVNMSSEFHGFICITPCRP